MRERTRAITSILNYTPAVVYLKDSHGRYNLVNPRFEELLGIKNEQIKGKSDQEIFPPAMAAQFSAHDLRVLREGRASRWRNASSCQTVCTPIFR